LQKVAAITAPTAGYITTAMADGSVVSAGTTLVSVHSDSDARTSDRMGVAIQLMELQASSVSDQQRTLRLQILQATKQVAEAYADYIRVTQAIVKTAADVGLIDKQTGMPAADSVDRALWNAAEARAKAEVVRSTNAITLFNLNFDQAKQRLALITDELRREQSALDPSHSRVALVSPLSGHLTLHVTSGAFVRKGDLVASVRELET
jgi:hypothetical protein